MDNCINPATKTPQAKANIGISNMGAINTAAVINETLNIIGVDAGKENLPWVFWIPPAKATKEIKAR